jgi:hypothetical protein
MLQILLRPNQNTAAARQNTHYNRRNAGNPSAKPKNYTDTSPPPSPTGYTVGEGLGSDWQGVIGPKYYSLTGRGNRGIQKGFMMNDVLPLSEIMLHFLVKVKLY